jgi:hypothetical protein
MYKAFAKLFLIVLRSHPLHIITFSESSSIGYILSRVRMSSHLEISQKFFVWLVKAFEGE